MAGGGVKQEEQHDQRQQQAGHEAQHQLVGLAYIIGRVRPASRVHNANVVLVVERLDLLAEGVDYIVYQLLAGGRAGVGNGQADQLRVGVVGGLNVAGQLRVRHAVVAIFQHGLQHAACAKQLDVVVEQHRFLRGRHVGGVD